MRRPTLEDVYLELTARVRLFLHELRTEQLLFWRNREAAFFTFFLPVIFFLIFGSIYGDSTITKEHIRAAPFLEAGMIGYGVAATALRRARDHAGRSAARVGRAEAHPRDAAARRRPTCSPCSPRRSSSS